MLSTCTLYQHVSEPTRFKPGILPSLVITNEEGMISGLSYLPPLGKSDHLSLWFSFNLHLTLTWTILCLTLILVIIRSQVQHIDWQRMLNMTMDATWDYFSWNSIQLLKTLFHYLIYDLSIRTFTLIGKFFD